MTLGLLLTAYEELIADWIINECDPTIDQSKFRMLRYHGHAIPDDIQCSEDGLLSVWWEPIRPKAPSTPCPGFLVVTLTAKFAVCWKQAEVSPKGITLFDPQWDLDAGRLADIAECVSGRLASIVCTDLSAVPDDDVYAIAFLEHAMAPYYVDTSAGGPQGGVAWITWRMQTGVRRVVPTS